MEEIWRSIDGYKNLAWYPQSDKTGIVEYKKKFNDNKKGRWKRIYSVSDDNVIEYFDNMQSALRFYNLPKYKSVYLRAALDNGTRFNDMYWFYKE